MNQESKGDSVHDFRESLPKWFLHPSKVSLGHPCCKYYFRKACLKRASGKNRVSNFQEHCGLMKWCHVDVVHRMMKDCKNSQRWARPLNHTYYVIFDCWPFNKKLVHGVLPECSLCPYRTSSSEVIWSVLFCGLSAMHHVQWQAIFLEQCEMWIDPPKFILHFVASKQQCCLTPAVQAFVN